MTERPTPTLAHLTWQGTNADRTVRFLSGLFGWTFKPSGDGYFVSTPPSGAWIGVTQVEALHHGNAFVPHISVPSLPDVVLKARSLGAEVVEENGLLPGVGRYADLRDPDGTLFTVIEFGAHDH